MTFSVRRAAAPNSLALARAAVFYDASRLRGGLDYVLLAGMYESPATGANSSVSFSPIRDSGRILNSNLLNRAQAKSELRSGAWRVTRYRAVRSSWDAARSTETRFVSSADTLFQPEKVGVDTLG